MLRSKLARWSMYPNLHEKLSAILSKSNLRFQFHNVDDDNKSTKSYDTNLMGKFLCNNDKCATHAWTSKKIATTIRMYEDKKYNARVYHQQCKACNTISQPILNEEAYVDRVAYRIKKWSGIKQDPPPYSPVKFTGKHKSHLCEGCKAGHCNEI